MQKRSPAGGGDVHAAAEDTYIWEQLPAELRAALKEELGGYLPGVPIHWRVR